MVYTLVQRGRGGGGGGGGEGGMHAYSKIKFFRPSRGLIAASPSAMRCARADQPAEPHFQNF